MLDTFIVSCFCAIAKHRCLALNRCGARTFQIAEHDAVPEHVCPDALQTVSMIMCVLSTALTCAQHDILQVSTNHLCSIPSAGRSAKEPLQDNAATVTNDTIHGNCLPDTLGSHHLLLQDDPTISKQFSQTSAQSIGFSNIDSRHRWLGHRLIGA
jgi:hypothetical protein